MRDLLLHVANMEESIVSHPGMSATLLDAGWYGGRGPAGCWVVWLEGPCWVLDAGWCGGRGPLACVGSQSLEEQSCEIVS